MLPFVRLWLWISAFASLAGWGLSAAGELNRTGYAVAAAAVAVFFPPAMEETINIQHSTTNIQ